MTSFPRLAAAVAVILTAAPLAAQTVEVPRPEPQRVVLTDAIRVEVGPGELSRCAAVFQWAFNLPDDDAGFGPTLPGVPYGFGPRCAVLPDSMPYVSASGD
ncbi:hypothetical protein ATO6_12035 [Oceanicola sp. 22II-s10i]|uniref:hypothetical protein n=1 Tax=Oceanicola sp. 22II-s10i TaxID=1317116 RepID=UPI000B527721|nr:hypothetical protein [Oceanicola sp. 22II-s10i]OWU84429.1 hypothetical protein ATO6_12035 [Oceanicola sp. 22II-s10i]